MANRILAFLLGGTGIVIGAFGLLMLAVLPRFQGMGASAEAVYGLPLLVIGIGVAALIGAWYAWTRSEHPVP